MYDLYEITNIAAHATVREMKKQGMLISFETTAFERTKDDMKNFKVGLDMLSDEQIPSDFKKKIAVELVGIQRSLKWLKDKVDDQDYMMFYEFNLTDQSLRSIAGKYGIDEKAVRTALNRCISRLSIFLHPDKYISEILY